MKLKAVMLFVGVVYNGFLSQKNARVDKRDCHWSIVNDVPKQIILIIIIIIVNKFSE